MTGSEREHERTKAKPAGAARVKPAHRIPGGSPSGLTPSFTWNTDSGGTVTSVLIDFDTNTGWSWGATAASFPARAANGSSVSVAVPTGMLGFTAARTLSRNSNSSGVRDQVLCIQVTCSDGSGGTETDDLMFAWQAKSQSPSGFTLSVNTGTSPARMTENTTS